jgi:hypothetical protein
VNVLRALLWLAAVELWWRQADVLLGHDREGWL